MIKSLGPGLDTTDFIRIALGSQHTFIVVQNSNLSKPLVITWPQLLRQIQDQLNIISGGSTIQVQDEGVIIDTTAQFLNFIGAGVNVTQNGNGVDITIPGGVGSAAWGSITGTITNQTDLVSYVATEIAAALVNYVQNTRSITINGLTQDLSADRTWDLTANNGVRQESGNPTNFELGGSIIKSTLIQVGPSSSGHDLQFDSNGPLDGSGKIKFTATTGSYTSTDKLVRFEADGAISAYFIARGTNGTGAYIQSISSGAIPLIISNASPTEILRMLNSGQLQLNLYNNSTAFQGSSSSSVGVLNVDNTGKVFVTTAGSYTVDNGLSAQPGSPTNFQLGSASSPGAPLLNNRYIDTGSAYTLNLKGQKTAQTDVILFIENTTSGGTGLSVNGSGSSLAIRAESTDSHGVYGISNTSVGILGQTSATSQGAILASVTSSASNLVALGLRIRHITSATPVAGLGVSIDFRGGTTINPEASLGRLMYQWTDAVTGSRTSKFQIETVNGATGSIIASVNLELLGSGQLVLNKYTTGTSFSSGLTSVGVLNVDNTGKVFVGTGGSGSGFVPYTGATQDVDLGTHNLTADHIALNTNPSGAGFVVGASQWNNTIGSSETLLKGGSVVLKNGVDLVARVVNKVVPNTTLTKAAYQAVRVSGATGGRLSIELAKGDVDANSADTIGLVCETINTNQEGFIITVGQLIDINTTGALQGETWADGDVLYLSPTTAGQLTNVKPNGSTGHIVVMGYVEYAHPTQGAIYVKVMNGWELDELHNVYINAPTTNQVLAYEAGTPDLWKNKNVIDIAPTSLKTGSCGVTFDGGSGTITNGKTAYVQIPYNGTLTGWTLVANTGGSCTVTPFKSTYMLFPPTSPGGNLYSVQPSITAPNQKNQNLSPTYLGSQATVTAGDYIGFTISGVTTVTWVNLTISITKT